ncbi:MAG: hypothetical protein H0W84_03570 [Bacteroidetes bacterium]|nr:hypothetical protein [Bacteroidota bacterium]
MKKVIYTVAIITCLLLTSQVYSQTGNQCYSFEKNENGNVESIRVKLTFAGNKVDTDYKKQSLVAGNASLITFSKQGVVEGNKIIFTAEQAIKVNGTQTNQNAPWTLKDNTLIVGEEVLKSVSCK